MENLEQHLLKTFSKKNVDHHLEVYAKMKQFIDSVLATSSSQNLDERSKTLFTGLQTIRDLIVAESNEVILSNAVVNRINSFKEREIENKKDIEQLSEQKVEKKTLSQEKNQEQDQ